MLTAAATWVDDDRRVGQRLGDAGPEVVACTAERRGADGASVIDHQ